MSSVKSPRKLIEVALPLDAINEAAAKEKSIRHGHPSTLHLWWARRPLAAARAVLFAQLVNDPGYQKGSGFKYGVNKEEAAKERERLFNIIRDLVKWENTNNEEVLEKARAEIRRSWREVCELNKDHPQAAELFNPEVLPAFHDPFAGGGTIPLEAQRLGLEAYASDLNPVAVMINKAMIEIPPKFSGIPPVNPETQFSEDKQGEMFGREWHGSEGLAADVRYYSKWMRDRANERIGHFYPRVQITEETAIERPDLRPLIGQELTVIAWLWVRTVRSPNPAFSHVEVPLASTFLLSAREGREAYIEPIIEGDAYQFHVKVGRPRDRLAAENGTKLTRGANFKCLMSGTPIDGDYIKAEGRAGRMGSRLMAVVAESVQGRVYLDAPSVHFDTTQIQPSWRPELKLSEDKRAFWTPAYGLSTFDSLFTTRQLIALTTFSDLLLEVSDGVHHDALQAGMVNDATGLADGGTGATAYAEAVRVFLAFCIDKNTLTNTTQATWQRDPDRLTQAYARQGIPMTWDFAEANPLSDAGGGFAITADAVAKVLLRLPAHAPMGTAFQHDASTVDISGRIVSTDPPYYDNIGYADLADYFYVWMRRSLQDVYPTIFATLLSPKEAELVAAPHRQGSKEAAEQHFLQGMTRALQRISTQAQLAFPLTIFYAFKQSDTDSQAGTSSAGWETFLEAVHSAGLQVTGTWPMRTELTTSLKKSSNALASSIVLVCRKRAADAPTCSRREFVRELNQVLPEALDEMTRGIGDGRSPIAPVDLSQAIIGPGMAAFSKYAAVLEANGEPMRVRTALQLINRFLAEDDFDADTQFCLHWFEQYGWAAGRFGEADTLARAKGTSVEGVREAGVIESGSGSVRLRKWAEYPGDWQVGRDARNPVWETLHHLIRGLKQGEGEADAGRLLAGTRSQADAVRQLAYRLYTLCERQGWAEDARAYNELITSWTAIEEASTTPPAAARSDEQQGTLFA